MGKITIDCRQRCCQSRSYKDYHSIYHSIHLPHPVDAEVATTVIVRLLNESETIAQVGLGSTSALQHLLFIDV
jgi:hypothetical protein